ncbi:hypothetical protein DES53_103322 [Roseimicrobium gellanilyticum]|uniref:DUF2029 domain-containing protein n=1 Tax=Roseimicrobium gellanilyticum TaxID=748857 RepID=A0A366HQE1_9BACT|nr:hypothetical protein [Roseimicrobium gellanilyticum]RBP45324.1 hypothetical protein DES53_103322 [Roseimicrobium gellanilyticum]
MILLIKLIVSLVCIVLAWRLKPLWEHSAAATPSFRRYCLAGFILTRVGTFVMVFFVLRMGAQSDINWYYNDAKAVEGGLLPLRDFMPIYGPWFSVACALLIKIFDSPVWLVFIAIVFEFISLPLWLKVGDRLFNPRISNLGLLLYVCSPLSLLNVPITGQNHIWFAPFIAGGMLLLIRHQSFLCGATVGASILAVKLLSLIFIPPFTWASKNRWACAAGFFCVVIPGYGWYFLQGADITKLMSFHSQHGSSGNLPFLLGMAGLDFSLPHLRSAANYIGLGLLSGLFLTAMWKKRVVTPYQALIFLPLLMIIVLIISKKSFASYLECALFPLCLIGATFPSNGERVALTAIGGLAACEPSIWYRLLSNQELAAFWDKDAAIPLPSWAYFSVAFVDVILLGSYVYLAIRLWRLTAKDRFCA